MKTPNIAECILHFNQGRHPELLRMKLERLRQDAFVFFRGTCHLFYDHWPADSALNEAPRVWICGDLHLENFCLDAYCRAMASGRARWVERETAKGLVRDLLESLRGRRRKRFLNERAKLVNGKRRFRQKHPRMLPVTKAERAQINAFFNMCSGL